MPQKLRPHGSCCQGVAVPLLDRVRRVGEHDVERPQPVALEERRVGEGVAARDLEVLDAVQEEVHAGDGAVMRLQLLPVEARACGAPPWRRSSTAAEMSMPPVPQVGS